MERAIQGVHVPVDIDTVMPQDLINAKPRRRRCRVLRLVAAFRRSWIRPIRFGRSPRSAVFALGRRLTRERAASRCATCTRRINGRICPDRDAGSVRTWPHQPLATFARVNKYGLSRPPYRRVRQQGDRRVSYLSAMEEQKFHVVRPTRPVDKDRMLRKTWWYVTRHAGDVVLSRASASMRWTCRPAIGVGRGR